MVITPSTTVDISCKLSSAINTIMVTAAIKRDVLLQGPQE